MPELTLKPCPFCGNVVDLVWWDSEHQNEKRWEPCDEDYGVVFPYISCRECDCTINFSTATGKAREAISAWNRRTTQQEVE